LFFSFRFLTLFPLSRSFQGIPPTLAKTKRSADCLHRRSMPLSDDGVAKSTESARHQFLVMPDRRERAKLTQFCAGSHSPSRVLPSRVDRLTRFVSFIFDTIDDVI
jgi:hypothetical protein